MIRLSWVLKWATLSAILVILLEPVVLHAFDIFGLNEYIGERCRGCNDFFSHVDKITLSLATDIGKRGEGLPADQRRQLASRVLLESCTTAPNTVKDQCPRLLSAHKREVLQYVMQLTLPRPAQFNLSAAIAPLCERSCRGAGQSALDMLYRNLHLWLSARGLKPYAKRIGDFASPLVGMAGIGTLLLSALHTRRVAAQRQHELYQKLVEQFRDRAQNGALTHTARVPVQR